MKLYLFLITVLLLPLLLDSCSNETPVTPTLLDTTSFTYPFQIGNSWNYTLTISLSDFKPDTISKYFTDYPKVIHGTASILYDTVINGVSTRCFSDVQQYDPIITACRYYYINDDISLSLYAIRGEIGGYLPDNINRQINNLTCYDFPGSGVISGFYRDIHDTLIITPFNTILYYPIHTGMEWYRYSGGYPVLRRKYAGFELVVVPSGTFSCMKVEKTYLTVPTAVYADYYSKYGIIKKTIFMNDVLLTTPEFPEGIGTGDLNIELVVNSYTIH
jgi:hypothetical protein